MRSARLLSLFLFLALSASGTWAALVVESVEQNGNEAEVSSKLTMDAAGLRADSEEGVFIFRPDKKVLWILDSAKKEYHQISESDMGEMTAKMSDAMAQMKEQLAQLPPEQRAMVEEMMKKQMPAGVSMGSDAGKGVVHKTTYEKVAGTEKIGAWTCDKYVEKENGEKVGEIWTVPASTFLSFGQYFKMLQRLGDFFSKMPMAQGGSFEIPMLKASAEEDESGLSGIPVKDIRYKPDGTTVSRWELKKISEESVEPALFEVPKEYKQRPMMEESP